MDKINKSVNSKNRSENENANKFTVKIPNHLLRLNGEEYFTLNANGFIVIIHVLIVSKVLTMFFRLWYVI